MERCLKCHGSLRIDWEFPGMVCQRCGLVYYFKPYVECHNGEIGKRRGGGWHRVRESQIVGDLAEHEVVGAESEA